MEDFIYQESRGLHAALTRGDRITWPTSCRNCDFEFPENLKSEVYRSLTNEPLGDLLSIVSRAFHTCCKGKYSYCCVNNFKPTFKVSFTAPEGDVKYHICTETICIEEGLLEWYDIEWDDETSISPLITSINRNKDTDFSLFDL